MTTLLALLLLAGGEKIEWSRTRGVCVAVPPNWVVEARDEKVTLLRVRSPMVGGAYAMATISDCGPVTFGLADEAKRVRAEME